MRKTLREVSLKNKKRSLRRLAVPAAVLIAAAIFIFSRGFFKEDGNGVTMAEVCKVLAYACGCQESEIDGGYWYETYVDYIKEKNIFEKINPDRGFSDKNAEELFEYLGLSYEDKYGVGDKVYFTKQQFAEMFKDISGNFEKGGEVKFIEAGIAATPDTDSSLANWRVCTDAGNFSFRGLKLSGEIDRTVSLMVMGDEILMVVGRISDDVEYRNVWAYKYEGNTLYVNAYGIMREFKVGGVSEQIGSVLADITLKNGKVSQIAVKSDTISGKILSIGSGYIEVTGYGRVSVDEDFIMYNVADYTADRNYSDIIVGYDLQDFIVAEGKICGAFLSKGLSAGNIRVLIKTTGYEGLFHDTVKLKSDTGYTVSCGDDKQHFNGGEEVLIEPSDSRFASGRIEIKPDVADGEIELLNISRSQGNPRYQGIIELSLWNEGIIVINDVDIEQYLKRVVPSEMPASFGTESLKVQAVCARSYAYRHLTNGGYNEYGAHVDDSTQYQVYNNTVEYDSANEAILATRGQMLRYNDEVVQAYYYSTSCGVGTDVSLWGSSTESYPYYVSRDIGENQRGQDYTDEAVFSAFIKSRDDKDYDSQCDYYRWKMRISAEKLSASFNNKLNGLYRALPDRVKTKNESGEFVSKDIKTVGTIQKITVDKRAAGGAAVCVTVEGNAACVRIESESLIRTAFGTADETLYTNTGSTNMSALPSTFCVFENITLDSGESGFEITGGGYGHGIGMSQNAVNAMTKRGMSYTDILQFFYPGTVVS